MKVTPIKTEIVHVGDDLFHHLSSIPQLQENSIVVVTSKIVSLCEGQVVKIDPTKDVKVQKDELVAQESEYYLPRSENQYGACITVKNNTFIASAGIDESNGEGEFILWPEDPQQSANTIRTFLQDHFNVKNIGVVIADSHVLPLRWGTQGTSIAHSGFSALNDYRGTPDIFGRILKISQANIAEGLASAGVLCMGEGKEQTPLAVIEDVPFVQFQDHNPTQEEIDKLAISLEEDIFGKIWTKADWKKGKSK